MFQMLTWAFLLAWLLLGLATLVHVELLMEELEIPTPSKLPVSTWLDFIPGVLALCIGLSSQIPDISIKITVGIISFAVTNLWSLGEGLEGFILLLLLFWLL